MSQKTFKILFNFDMKNFEFNVFKNEEMISDINNLLVKGPVHTYPDSFVSANILLRIWLSSTRIRRKRTL